MGLTARSTGLGALKEMLQVQVESPADLVVALAGNPNTGKSTIFNSLTGLRQHTGNWPGKTVSNAQGRYVYRDWDFVLVDLPGTYSLLASSVEEEVARDFICFAHPHATVVVADATCLERNLNLALQIMEITDNVIVCVNLLDEAKHKQITVDLERLASTLGVPVVGTNARDGVGLPELQEAILRVCQGDLQPRPARVSYDPVVERALDLIGPIGRADDLGVRSRWAALRLLDGDRHLLQALEEHLGAGFADSRQRLQRAQAWLVDQQVTADNLRDRIVGSLVSTAERVVAQTVRTTGTAHLLDRRIDNIVTSRRFGIPLMLLLLGLVFWVTMQGANLPSALLAGLFSRLEQGLSSLLQTGGWPEWLHGLLVNGVFRTLAWVVAVMLPPMAIFFPLFTLLEDLGYLPRVAFNLDSFFKRACAHGKQALTMCMGFGCNAAGVVACRIIDSPRERLIATITNSFVPCNGRFPLLIALSSIFLAGGVGGVAGSVIGTLAVLASIVLAVVTTLLISRLLSRTLLKGLPSSFALELPPYRRPQIGRILLRSLLDRTLFVLGRAVVVAAPAGVVIWVMANVSPGGISLLSRAAAFLQPFAHLIGMDGHILMAFILALPANEIVLPIVIMSYLRGGVMIELDSLTALRSLLVQNGWTWLTAVCVMLFSLNHWPCATTLLTIRKETQSTRWTLVSLLLPTITGVTACFLLTTAARLLGLA